MNEERSDPRLSELCYHQVPIVKCPICSDGEPSSASEQVSEMIRSIISAAGKPFHRKGGARDQEEPQDRNDTSADR
jgi:hypothetical protein